MEPVFTLPYSEWAVAQRLASLLPAPQGFSLPPPLSRQEKGVDLVVTCRKGRVTRAASLQVKASRTYSRPAPSERTKDHAFDPFFNRFPLPDQADFVALVAMYPTEVARQSRAKASWWAPVILLFTHAEMHDFLASVRTRDGRPDRMFGFGFDSEAEVFQTRGDQQRRHKSFTEYLVASKIGVLRTFLTGGATVLDTDAG